MENKEQTLWERLKYTYRLIIMNNDTFEEVGSYRLSLLNVYVVLSTIVVLVAIMMWMLITYTPLKQYIPGYSEHYNNPRLIAELTSQVDELEQERQNRDFYIQNLQQMLSGDVEEIADVQQEIESTPDSTARLLPSEEEEKIREEMQNVVNEPASFLRTNGTASQSLEQLHFIPPISGEISKGFDEETEHYGIDLVAPKNTAIKAVMDGYVFFADWTMETGNVIGLQHANNTVTFYKHNSSLLKEIGSFVKAGEAIAVIGNTGTKTDGLHLHFELWHHGKAIDPSEYITFL
ncbi:MAG: M23 family metallopeptidase [Bacteroidota bacterium]